MNNKQITILTAALSVIICSMYFIINDASSYRQAEQLAQDVDISNVCYFDDEPYYHEYVSAAAIPLMTLDKQSDDAPAELLAVFDARKLDYKKHHVPDWIARGPLAQWFGGYGSKDSIGRNQHGVPCEVVMHSVSEPKILSLFLVMLGALLLISWRGR